MTLYRLNTTLDYPGGQYGAVMFLDLPETTINILLEQELISIAHPPPLSLLPGWTVRAKKLKTDDVEEFLTMDDATVAKALRIPSKDVPLLKQSVLHYLKAPSGG